MDACFSVEREIEKVLSKFSEIDRQTADSIQELLLYVENIKEELEEGW